MSRPARTLTMASAIAGSGAWQLMNAAESDASRRNTCAVSESDDALILAAAGGDRNAFGRLIDRHSARAFAVAFRMVGNRADAEDVVQDAFIRAWRHAERWQPGRAAFSTWLYRVIVNLAIDLKRRPRHDALEQVAEPLDDAPDAETELARRQRTAAVTAASAALPDRQRQAIALCFGAGMSNKAAAEVIGVSVKALESLLIRAKRSMRDAVAAQGWHTGEHDHV